MKQLLLGIFCVAFGANLSAQNPLRPKVDTIISEQWTGNVWQNSSKLINNYNGSCLLASTLFQFWNTQSSTWVNDLRYTFTYSGDDLLSTTLFQTWNTGSSSWDNNYRTTNTYNVSSQVQTALTEGWDGSTWQNGSLITNTYDVNGYIFTALSQYWAGAAWRNTTLDTYTHNSDGTVSQHLSQTWNTGTMAWDNNARETNTYNADKSIYQYVSETWNTGTMAWDLNTRETYTYTAGKPATTLTEIWETTNWVNDHLTTNTYNGGNQLINTLDQVWNGSSWDNDTQENITSNGDGTHHQIVEQTWNSNTNAWDNTSRSTFYYTTSCTLPLKLLDFTAALSGKNVLLNWTTVTEINTKYFDIERSKDAIQFTKIGSVNASGNSTQKLSYQYTDATAISLGAGKVFYRLKMVDQDGKFTYSKIAFVVLTPGGSSFAVFPNPVRDQLFLVFNGQNAGQGSVRIIDQYGKQVYTQQVNSQQTGSQLNINISTLKRGIYYIQVVTADGVKSAKFVKP